MKRNPTLPKQEISAYRQLFEHSHEGMIIGRPDGTITEANDAICRMLGYSAAELIAKKRAGLAVADDPGMNQGLKERNAAGHYQGPMKFQRKDGSVLDTEILSTLYTDTDGEALTYTLVRDIGERQRAETALRSSEHRMRALIKHGQDIITMTAADGQVIYRSPSYNTQLGYDPEQMDKSLEYDLVHPDDIAMLKDKFTYLAQNPGMVVCSRWRQSNSNGEWRWMEGSGVNLLHDPAVAAIVSNFRDITTHITIEHELGERSRELNYLFNAVDEMLYTGMVHPYRLTHMSDACVKVYGYEPADFLADVNLWTNVIVPEDQHVTVSMGESLWRGETARGEYRIVHREGSIRWVESIVTPTLNERGQMLRFDGVIRDITDRKLAKEALHESERKFRSLTENSKDAIILSGSDRRLKYLSNAIKDILGYEPEELIGTLSYELFHPDEQEENNFFFSQIMDPATPSATKLLRARHRDGSWRWIELTATNALADPVIGAIISNLHDVTEKKNAEEALNESERKFRALIENSKDAIALIDKDWNLTYLSPAITDILGYAPEELNMTMAHDLLHPADLMRNIELLVALSRGYTLYASDVLRVRHKDGSWRWVEVTVANQMADPAVGALVSTFRDVTGKKNAEEAVLQSEKKFRSLIENNKDVIALLDRENRFIYISPSISNIVGYEPDYFIGKTPHFLWSADEAEKYTKENEAALKGVPVFSTRQVHHRDGSWRWIEVYLTDHLDDPAIAAMVVNVNDITQRKLAEEAVLNSEKKFRSLIEKNKDVIVLLDSLGFITYCSPQVDKVLGYAPEENTGKHLSQFWHPDEYNENLRLQRMLLKGEPISTIVRLKHKDKSWRWIEVDMTNHLSDPAIGAIVANMTDITERKKAEKAVLQSEKKFRSLIENGKDIVVLTDQERRIKYISPSVTRTLGYEPEFLIGKGPQEIWHPDDLEPIDKIRKVLGPGQSATYSQRLLHSNGEWRWFQMVATNHFDDPAIGATVINMTDITERKNAEEALLNSEKRFRSLIEYSKDAISLTDADRKMMYASPAYKEILGYEPEEVIGRDVADFWHPDEAEENLKEHSNLLGTDYQSRVMRLLHKNGTWRWIHAHITNHLHDPLIMATVANLSDITDRKNAEEAVLQSEKKFRSLTENNKEGITLTSRERRFIYVSPSVKDLLGYSTDDMLGQFSSDFLHPDDREPTADRIRELHAAENSSVTFVTRLLHKDGSYRWAEMTLTNQLEEPSVCAMVANFRDITDRKNAEEAVLRSEQKFRSLIENNKEGITLTSSERRFLYVSPSVHDMLGYSADQMLGHFTNDFFHPDEREPMAAHIRELLTAPGNSVTCTTRLLHKDGSYRWVEMTITNQVDEPSVCAVVANFRDISERKNAEEAVLQSEKKFRSLIENSKDVISLTDADRRFLYLSPSITEVLGYTPEEMVGKHADEFWHADEIQKNLEQQVHVLNEKSTSRLMRLRHKNGSWRWIHARITNHLADPAIAAVVANLSDITDRKNAEDAVLRSEKKFRSLVENSTDLILLTNMQQQIIYASPAVKDVMGYSPEELIGKPAASFWHPDEVAENNRNDMRYMVDKTHTRIVRIRHRDGSWRWVQASLTNYLSDPAVEAIVLNITDITERKNAEDAVVNSEKRFRSLIENNKDIITLSSRDKKLIYLSPSIVDLLGFEPHELLGRSPEEFWHPDELAIQQQERQKLAPGESLTKQMQVRHRDGSWRWIQAKVTNHLDDPAIAAVVSNMTDITERKKIEDALVNSEKRFRSLIENSKDAIMLTDRSRNIVYISPSIANMMGYTPAEMIGQIKDDMIEPADLPAYIEQRDRIQPGETATAYLRARHHDGSVRLLEIVMTNRFDDPAVAAMVTNVSDVTDKKNAEAALVNSEKRFRSLIENSTDIITLTDADRNIIYLSPSITDLLGYTPEEMMGHKVFEYWHPDEMLKNTGKNSVSLSTPGLKVSNVLRLMHKDGSWRWVRATITNQLHDPAIGAIVGNMQDITERKNAEDALMNSEKRFRSLVENSKDAIALTGKDRKLIYLSPAIADILGYTPEEMTGKDPNEFWHPEEVEEQSGKRESLQPGESISRLMRVRHRDGSWRWLQANITNHLDDPAIGAMVNNLSDVTTEKNALQAMLDSEKKFRSLIEKSKDAIALTGSDGRFVYVSPSVCDIVGYEPEELVGRESKEFWHPDEMAQMSQQRAAFGPGQSLSRLMRIRHKNGSWRWLQANITNHLNDPAIGAIVNNLSDVTEKKAAEQALLDSEKRFRALIENNKEGIGLTDRERRFIYFSPSMTGILGYEPEELIGKDSILFYHPDDLEMMKEMGVKLRSRENLYQSTLVRIRHKDGTWRWIELTSSNMLDEPAVGAIVTNFRDVTDRKNAEDEIEQLNQNLEKKVEQRTQQLEESNKALESFSYIAAHDLQSPIKVMAGYASLLKEEYGDQFNDECKQMLTVIIDKAKDTTQLVSDLLEYSRVSHVLLHHETIDMTDMVQDVADQLTWSGYNPAATVTVNALGHCTCDAGLVKQAWTNLISNALKYSKKKDNPVIEIGCEQREYETVYYVRDNGAGFDMANAGKLFTVFKRLHSAHEFEGTGVGLAIVSNVINRHGGRIWAEAEVDKGATFYFTLPG